MSENKGTPTEILEAVWNNTLEINKSVLRKGELTVILAGKPSRYPLCPLGNSSVGIYPTPSTETYLHRAKERGDKVGVFMLEESTTDMKNKIAATLGLTRELTGASESLPPTKKAVPKVFPLGHGSPNLIDTVERVSEIDISMT